MTYIYVTIDYAFLWARSRRAWAEVPLPSQRYISFWTDLASSATAVGTVCDDTLDGAGNVGPCLLVTPQLDACGSSFDLANVDDLFGL